jgi:hypothetical protein
MTPSILAAYLRRNGVPNDAILTDHDMHLKHNQCIYDNLDLSYRNYNIWQSVVYLFSFLIKAPELAHQTIQQIELNDVTKVLQAIDDFIHCVTGSRK